VASNYYGKLNKPSWSPPSWLFGPVWLVLYIIILISFGYVFYLLLKGIIPFLVFLPFVLNLVFNFAFTPIQFRLKNNILASADILLVIATLVWALYSIHPYASWVSYVNIPYALWGIFATVLQLTITLNNRKNSGPKI